MFVVSLWMLLISVLRFCSLLVVGGCGGPFSVRWLLLIVCLLIEVCRCLLVDVCRCLVCVAKSCLMYVVR